MAPPLRMPTQFEERRPYASCIVKRSRSKFLEQSAEKGAYSEWVLSGQYFKDFI